MNPERHLLPDEIDLLVDGEASFELASLRAHARKCDRCRSEVEAARALVAEIEHLPALAPSPLFAERVMSQVQVFEPAHVAALDTVRRWMPTSAAARAAAVAIATTTTVSLTALAFWVATRLDVAVFFGRIMGERLRGAVVAGIGQALSAMFGPAAIDTLRSGNGVTIAATSAGLVLGVGVAVLALRGLAVVSRQRRR